MNNKPSLRKRIITFVSLIILTVALVTPLCVLTKPNYDDYQCLVLDEGWNITVNDAAYENVTLSTFTFPICNSGDYLVLTHELPLNVGVDNPTLRLYSVHAVFKVYLDDEQIYSYGEDLYKDNRMLGYGRSYIKLPSDYEGRTLKVTYFVTENNAFDGIQTMRIENGASMIRMELAENRFNVAVAIFLIMFGFMGMIVSIFVTLKDPAFIKTTFITIFSFLTGVWSMCSGDMITLFCSDLKVKVILEYSSFYLLLLPFLGYFFDTANFKTHRAYAKWYYRIIFLINVVFDTVVLILHLTNKAHFSDFVLMQHGMIFLALIFFVMIAIGEVKERKRITSLSVGFTLTFSLVLVELLLYNIRKYVVGFKGNEYVSTLQVAALILVCTLIFDFYDHVARTTYESMKANLLEKMAYVDELTNLANRRKCNEIMDSLSGDNYSIISLDMNGLKFINDNYGHEEGDNALKIFAELLGKGFPNIATCGRMGGDEYIVIYQDATKEEVAGNVSYFEKIVDEYNMKSNLKYNLHYAYGIARGDEAENPYEVYSLADSRMYQKKRQMKGSR